MSNSKNIESRRPDISNSGTTTAWSRAAMSGAALFALAILFVAVMLVADVALRGARVDLTQNHLYTLSQGTKNIVSSIDEPIHLYLFYSEKGSENLPQLRTYYLRVREMLEEMVARSGGKLKLKVIDPLPFSEDEDRATAFGLQSVPVGASGEKIFFGLAGTNSTDGQAAIPFLQPNKEAFLEYDVAKMIHGLSESHKPVVGLLSSLDITGGFDPETRQMKEGWAIDQQWAQLFDVRKIDPASLKAIDKDIDVLVLVHPKALSDDVRYAIDQFVLRGGHLLVFVDPNAELDESGVDPSNPSSRMFADRSSNLPKLFKAWGIDYDPQKVVLDRSRGLPISTSTGSPPVRHPAVIGFTHEDMSQDDVITAKLDSVNVSTAGYFALDADAKDEALAPLIQTTADATTIATSRVRMLPDPQSLLDGYTPSGEHYVIAGRLTGKLKTAFPERTDEGHIAQAKDDVQIILVADTDILSDRLWVQIQDFFGKKLMNAFANNGDFAINAVDNLGGSSDLISIRGRATSQRPFTTVVALQREADERFRSKEQELQKELSDTEQKLTELQGAKSQDQATMLSPEQSVELEKFMDRKLEIRKELRQVRRQLDARIESLGTRLKLINIGLMPLLVTLIALGFAWWRSRRRDEEVGGGSI